MWLQQSEALGLRWQVVDLERGTLKVHYQLQRLNGEVRLIEPKTKLSRRMLASRIPSRQPSKAIRPDRRRRRSWSPADDGKSGGSSSRRRSGHRSMRAT
jgi:integrase